MKIKLTKCWEERKEGNERQNRYAKLDEEDLYILKINFKGKRTVGEAKE